MDNRDYYRAYQGYDWDRYGEPHVEGFAYGDRALRTFAKYGYFPTDWAVEYPEDPIENMSLPWHLRKAA